MGRVAEIWSGGQTGVDRAALDAAIACAIPTGGWVPRGRMAEDGPIAEHYGGLRETESAKLAVRTRRNVRDSDATLILYWGEPSGGTLLTRQVAERLGKPHLLLDLATTDPEVAAVEAGTWLQALPGEIRLNVAGPRASQAPGAYAVARAVVQGLLTHAGKTA